MISSYVRPKTRISVINHVSLQSLRNPYVKVHLWHKIMTKTLNFVSAPLPLYLDLLTTRLPRLVKAEVIVYQTKISFIKIASIIKSTMCHNTTAAKI